MDANANPEKAKGSSEAAASKDVDVSWKNETAAIPEVESPKLVPDQREPEPVKAAKSPVTALVIVGQRLEQATYDAGDRAADKAREKFKAFAGKLRGVRFPKITPLAATVMLAASIGAVAGSLGTVAVSVAMAPSPTVQAAEARAMKDTITALRSDLANIKTASEASVKSASTQLAKMAERLDRAERAQRLAMVPPAPVPPATVPAVKSPVAASTNAASDDVTGSIAPPRPPLGFNKDNSRPVIAGWTLQNVYDGTAYIQSREGPMEVTVGDMLPDGGRVEAIRRTNGRWVVVTTNGLVVMR